MTLSHNEQTAHRLFLATLDMQEVRRYLDAYVELNERGDHYHYHCEAILSAAIVAYCRPFKHSRYMIEGKGKRRSELPGAQPPASRQERRTARD